ncbi:small basic protein, partial [Chlamydiia bacterium]|nr:small basic protein [Chlamydiia bacterium]
SYGKQNRGSTKRNVLTRFERIEQLKKEKKWDSEDSSVFKLPKA